MITPEVRNPRDSLPFIVEGAADGGSSTSLRGEAVPRNGRLVAGLKSLPQADSLAYQGVNRSHSAQAAGFAVS